MKSVPSLIVTLGLAVLAPGQEPPPEPGAALDPLRDQEPLARGTTVPEDRELAHRLATARRFLAEERWESAVSLLQEIAEGDPTQLVRTDDDLRLVGAAVTAADLLAALPAPARSTRERLFGARAAREVEAALLPPDLDALARLAWVWRGTAAGERARRALVEAFLDRGRTELARRLLAPGEPLPEALAGGPPPTRLPLSLQQLPQVTGAGDPTLPLLRADDLDWSWDYDFQRSARLGFAVRHRLAIGGGRVYASNGFEIAALEIGTGDLLWRDGGDPRWDVLDYRRYEELRAAVTENTWTAPVLAEGVVLAVLQEAVVLGRTDAYSRIPIRRALPARRLHAFDAETGELLWKMDVPWDGPDERREPRMLAAAPPTVAGGRVFLPVYDAVGTIDLSLAALDLHTGRLLWTRFLASGQLETNLFGNVLRELGTPPPAVDGDLVLVVSHLGSLHAVAADTGAVRWTRLYPRIEIRPSETGRIAMRRAVFGHNLLAAGGGRLAAAPVDAPEGLLLDDTTGALIRTLPAVWDDRVHMSHLVALGDDELWAVGSRVFRVPLDPAGRVATSAPLYEENSVTPGRGGAMVRGEVLATNGTFSVERFDARTLRHLGTALDFGRQHLRSGALQVAPGLLFVLRPDGISAYASPSSLLAALGDAALTPEGLRELLPIATSFGLAQDPLFARRLAEAALALADSERFPSEEDALRLLAARSLAASARTAQAASVLADLLQANDPETRLAAAALLLDLLPETDPASPLLGHAAATVRELGAGTLVLRDGRRHRADAVLARARAAAALARGDTTAARHALAALLLLPDLDGLRMGDAPLDEWARERLEEVLVRRGQRAEFEAEAGRAFADAGLTEATLRAYAATEAAQDALAEAITRARRDGSDRARRLQLARWRRQYGDPARPWPDLDDWFPRLPTLPRLPSRLRAVAETRLQGRDVLAFVEVAGRRYVFLRDRRDRITVLAAEPGRLREVQSFRLPDSGFGLPQNVEHSVFPTRSGVALVLAPRQGLQAGRLLHLGVDGARREILLPGPLLQSHAPIRVGDGLVALLLRAGNDRLRLVVLDPETGVDYLEEVIPGVAGRMHQLVAGARHLHVLAESSSRVVRIDLAFAAAPTVYGLPFLAQWADIRTAAADEERVVLAYHRGSEGAWVVRAGPDEEPLVLPQGPQELAVWRPARSLAWMPVPLSPRLTASTPRSLAWLPPGAGRPWTRELDSPTVRIPAVELGLNRPLPHEDALVYLPAGDEALRIESWRLGRDAPSWAVLVGVPYHALREILPLPVRGAEGWAVPLLVRGGLGDEGDFVLLLFDDAGRLVDREVLPIHGGGALDFGLHLLDGALLAQDGDTLILFTENP